MTAVSARGSRREKTCNAILDATAEIIAKKGVDGFSISEIARHAGINRALIYHYFKNREILVTKAISHVIGRYQTDENAQPGELIERSIRMYISHPEVGRLFYQLLLNDRPLLDLGARITRTVEGLERFQKEHAPDSTFDPAFAVIGLVLSQLAWSFSREEFARILGISVDEADERFISHMRQESEAALRLNQTIS